MKKRFLSIIIVPHYKGKFKTITFSKKRVTVLTGVASFLSVALLFFLVDYSLMNINRYKYKALLKISENQKQTIAQYKNSIEELKGRIENFDNYVKKLNIIAGLKSPEVLREVGIGSGTSAEHQDALASNLTTPLSLDQLKEISEKAESLERNLDALYNFFEDQKIILAGTPSIAPTKGYWVSSYGWRVDPFTGMKAFHKGIDIATHYGNSVVATADGLVIETTKDKIGGNTVKITHWGGFTTVYCHLSKFLVKPGQRVKRGEVIGLVGKTGKALGPHVHYEVHLNGKPLNPYYYILEE